MIGVGEEFPFFELNGVNGDKEIISATLDDYDGWKIIYFYPKDFTFICPTEIAGFDSINVDADIIGISGDNEFCKLAWRREHPDLKSLNQWSFSDTQGTLVDALGIRSEEGVAYRATFIIDPHSIIQHITVNNLNVGRNPSETLRILDALQTDELCPCNRPVGGETI